MDTPHWALIPDFSAPERSMEITSSRSAGLSNLARRGVSKPARAAHVATVEGSTRSLRAIAVGDSALACSAATFANREYAMADALEIADGTGVQRSAIKELRSLAAQHLFVGDGKGQ